ncbi:MAG: DUF309 domain-containing protein [Dehalococcoidia bacterium]
MQPTRRRKQLVTKTITVPGNFQRACDDFNAGRFFESHEHIEEIWQYETGPVRDAYKGLIQIAAAFVHFNRGNHFGTERLLRTALGYLAPYRPQGAMGFDIEGIASAAEGIYSQVVTSGAARLADVDVTAMPIYEFDRAKLAAESLRWNAWGFSSEGQPLEMEITVAE